MILRKLRGRTPNANVSKVPEVSVVVIKPPFLEDELYDFLTNLKKVSWEDISTAKDGRHLYSLLPMPSKLSTHATIVRGYGSQSAVHELYVKKYSETLIHVRWNGHSDYTDLLGSAFSELVLTATMSAEGKLQDREKESNRDTREILSVLKNIPPYSGE